MGTYIRKKSGLFLFIWSFVLLLCIVVFVWSLVVRYSIFQVSCSSLSACMDPGQLLVEDEAALEVYGLSLIHYSSFRILIDFIQGAAIICIGVIIFIKKTRDWFALFVSISIMASGAVITIRNLWEAYPEFALLLRTIEFMASGYVIFFYVFPNGKFVPRWTFYIGCLWVFTTVGRVFFSGSPIDPFTWKPILNYSGWIAFHVLAILSQIYRYKFISNSIERQQVKWFLFGLAGLVAGIIIEILLDNSQHLLSPGMSRVFVNLVVEVINSFLYIAIPISIGFAMQKYRLWDIDYMINRALLYTGLSACVILLYIVIVGSISALFQSNGNLISSILASALVALFFQPLQNLLQRIINRFMYGERDNPYVVLTQMGKQLESTLAPHDILPTSVETLAKKLKLPYVAIMVERDGKEVVAASTGTYKEPTLRIPLIYQGESMGTLLLSSRSLHDEFSTSERNLLNDLAPQVGIAIYNVRLTEDLRRARKKLVNAREEERKRLRRDLHDSLGPELAGLTMQMDAAQNMLYEKPEQVSELLTQMNNKLKLTIGDIREIVYALRPPVLDEFGLIYAIREQVIKLNQAGNEINIVVTAPELMPELPAAVEAAAYRIVQEAVTNVIKHSKAQNCYINIEINDDLLIEVVDDGSGFNGQRKGIGSISMKERAEELGGFCVIERVLNQGTKVLSRIPIPKGEDIYESY